MYGSATLTAPVTARVGTPAGGWRCDESGCRGPAGEDLRTAVAVCTMLTDKLGRRVAAFSVGDRAFGEAELARCNRHVKGAA